MIAMAALIGIAAGHAVDRRPAINVAWEWGGIALAYVLVRCLPRTRGESMALIGVLLATSVAVSTYGIFQAAIEFPEMQQKYRTNAAYRARAQQIAGVRPGTPALAAFENRLLGSNEPYSTFGLPNSLAGFLVGPLVVMLATGWQTLTRRGNSAGSRWVALMLGAVPMFLVLVCLTMTKSRSAYIGLAVAVLVLAWRERKIVSRRTLILGGVAGLLVIAGLVVVGMKMGRLDPLVLTQSGKSFQYRQQYWIGAWRAINESRARFWWGYGPANFSAAYVKHKLPEASEEISDPHNLLLEVWAAGGAIAAFALSAAVILSLWNTLGPGTNTQDPEEPVLDPVVDPRQPGAPPRNAGWLIFAGSLGWIVVLIVGDLNLFAEGYAFSRWLILGAAWAFSVLCGMAIWKRNELSSAMLGAAAVAVFINLTAAGGIGIPTVALTLWTLVAVGLNLRSDRSCGRLRLVGGRLAAFATAGVWVALLGTFLGAVNPYWKCEAAMNEAAIALEARPPAFDRAEKAYDRAKSADIFSARPWLASASLDFEVWQFRGAKPSDLHWKKIPIEMLKAVSPPRTPLSWARHHERARMTSLLLRQLGGQISPKEALPLRGDWVQSCRTASRLYPTNASLHAWLAEASAEIGMIHDALTEGREALRLDALTPHADKKLDPDLRLWLQNNLPKWEGAAATAPDFSKVSPGSK